MAHTAHLLLQVLGYAVFLRPWLYWIPNSLPFLELGITEFEPDFPLYRLPSLASALVSDLLDRLSEINRVRIHHAAKLARALAEHPDFRTPKPAQESQPIYIRFPVIARDKVTRDRVLARLRAVGIGASAFYPSAICDIAGIEKYMVQNEFHRPRAEDLARRLFTLPTHPFVGQADLDRIIEAVRAM